MTAGTDAPAACAVCGDAIDPAASANCNWCDAAFHLNQRNDIEAKDCGRVWIDEQFMALQFACNACLSNGQSAPDANSQAAKRPPRRARRYRRRE